MADEMTFTDLKRAINEIVNDASGYNRYPAPYHRIFMFQNSETFTTAMAVAEVTELGPAVTDTHPNRPMMDVELLNRYSQSFQMLRQALQRSPRRLEDENA